MVSEFDKVDVVLNHSDESIHMLLEGQKAFVSKINNINGNILNTKTGLSLFNTEMVEVMESFSSI